jgi:hypothetical protein
MSIRTTVTLDDDVLARAKQFSHERGIPFRQGLNELVRLGLLDEAKPAPGSKTKIRPFTRRLGLPPGLNYNHIDELEMPGGPLNP